MNIIVYILLAFCSFSAATAAFAQTADETVQAVEKYYGRIADLTARVQQKNILKSLGKTQTFEATLYIKKPGRLRLDYTNGQIILVDGKVALFYSRKSGQVVKRTFADIAQMNIPVAFLLGAANIKDDFEVSQPDAGDPRVLDLVPGKPGAAMKRIRLVADASGRVTALTIFDKSGNTTELSFSEIREGIGLEDGLFVFKPPKGTEIIEQ